jgi:hypothetical protein
MRLVFREQFLLNFLPSFVFKPSSKMLIFSYFYLVKLGQALIRTQKKFWFSVCKIEFRFNKNELKESIFHKGYLYSQNNFVNFIRQLLMVYENSVLCTAASVIMSDILVYKFLRRVLHLLTKRGGKHRAFQNLDLVLNAVRKSALQEFRSSQCTINPILKVILSLRTYFSLRKVTKRRKTLLIPGILPKEKRIRVIAR